jgi:hypothetical protein
VTFERAQKRNAQRNWIGSNDQKDGSVIVKRPPL